MEPILIDVPSRIETKRLVLRVPRAGDGPLVNDAIGVSHAELAPWMPWAGTMPSVDESEAHCRRQQARFLLREDFVFFMFVRDAAGAKASSSAPPACTASTGRCASSRSATGGRPAAAGAASSLKRC